MTELLDNDVLLKGSCYGLLPQLIGVNCEAPPIGYLAVARFVLIRKLKKVNLRGERSQAESRLLAFLADHESIEPTQKEQDLASELEASAQTLALPLDTGESQLLAILAIRQANRLLTGDKRAIAATEALLDSVPVLVAATGKLKCVEQLFRRAVEGGGIDAFRVAICGEPDVDRTLTICFQCSAAYIEAPEVCAAFDSYINDLRRIAPRVLAT
jgi:hypothetical protein